MVHGARGILGGNNGRVSTANERTEGVKWSTNLAWPTTRPPVGCAMGLGESETGKERLGPLKSGCGGDSVHAAQRAWEGVQVWAWTAKDQKSSTARHENEGQKRSRGVCGVASQVER